jgi:NADPH-dependent 2,4-dienoyl-CoA reductase/sulfur reductase-like enzyme
MEMEDYKYVIIGGGVVAGSAAKEFVAQGMQPGELCIVSAESTLPYDRPPLSKDFLAGEKTVEEILLNPSEFYTDHGIDLYMQTVVGRVDVEHKVLYTSSEMIGFRNLLIATGARVRKLNVPGSGLEGIYYLRRVEDSQRIREAARKAERAVVIGGAFIGMEVASVLQRSGVKTSIVFPEERVWKAFFTPQMSEFFESYYRERNVEILPENMVDRFEGGNFRVTQVELKSGKRLPADMVVVGIGVEPNTEIFAHTPIKVEDGILVNEYLETNVPGIYAAGDVARYPDALFGENRRFEHWDNAIAQGAHSARVMLGEREPFVHVPYFFSDVFDLSYEYWGDANKADDEVVRGDIKDGSFSVWWIKEGHPVAAFVLNRPDEERNLAPRWIEKRQPVSVEQLIDADHPLAEAELEGSIN